MTLAEFNRLDLKDQLEITWEKGVIEDAVTYNIYHYVLYKVDDFFVEISFRMDSNEFIHLQCFN
jgi:hypothetical protein